MDMLAVALAEELAEAPDVAAEAPEVGRTVGTLRVTPTALQRSTLTCPTSVLSLLVYALNDEVSGQHILVRSSALHRAGAHWRRELWMVWRPVVHWHLVSARLQPEPWTAVAKQGSCCTLSVEIPGSRRACVYVQRRTGPCSSPEQQRKQRWLRKQQRRMWRNAYWVICGGYLLSWKRSERYKVARINKEYESVYMNNESEERERVRETLFLW
jgi:hypothetical protein